MKRNIVSILVLLLVISTAYAEGVTEGETATQTTTPSQSADSPVPQMDRDAATIAQGLHDMLVRVKAQKIAIGQFPYQGSVTSLGTYWNNQLSRALVSTSGRSYAILSGGTAGADWTISGEIVTLPGIIRIYTRLMRVEDRALELITECDFERSTALAAMLSGGGSGGSSQTPPDELEPDGWENPVAYEIGTDESATVINRSIHAGDEDFFLLVPDRDGRLTVETTGNNIDTFMHLHDFESRNQVASDDDSGSGDNARIRYNVQAGKQYVARVRGYSSSTNGPYGFRAYIAIREGSSSWESPIAYTIGVGENSSTTNRELSADDEGDYFLLVPGRAGSLTIETTGDTDTCMELYNAETREKLRENDDGGSNYNARIRHTVSAADRYIVLVRGYDGEAGSYGFRAFFSGEGMLGPDEYESDDESSQAKPITIGTPQRHTFHHADDVDWVTFRVTQPRSYTISAKGERTARLDTYVELFDANLNSIAEDDDGGEIRDARLAVELQSGLYYLKVWCLDSEPDQAYTISIE